MHDALVWGSEKSAMGDEKTVDTALRVIHNPSMNDQSTRRPKGHRSLGYAGNDTYRCECGVTFSCPLLSTEAGPAILALKDQWNAHLDEVKATIDQMDWSHSIQALNKSTSYEDYIRRLNEGDY